MNKNVASSTQKLVGLALFTAIVVVLQLLGSFIHLGPFSISLVLMPIVVGTALYGLAGGAWLGFVFGVVVLVSGDAAAFLAINVPGTILTVLIKGAMAGVAAGLVFKALEKKNQYVAVICAAIASPIANTGLFLIGCRLFFYETIAAWGEGAGFASTVAFMFIGLVGMNFVVELVVNMVLSPVIMRLINLGRRNNL
ncbi:MAG: ECF transporter S component [Lachnospiraceae bacterium]|nr:ECF transporter S component [Candidatus Equihabitans merdae]